MIDKLPIQEDLDFHYLLSLMVPLHNEPEFQWLPELFSIIGHEKLITLCKYAGGEKIVIPTVTQLSKSINALQEFYDVFISKKKQIHEVPDEVIMLVEKIRSVYYANNS